MRRILDREPKRVNELSDLGEPPLVEAINGRRYVAAQLLLERGADVNLVGHHEKTPLHHAVGMSPRFVELLLAHGADVERLDQLHYSPLLLAASECPSRN